MTALSSRVLDLMVSGDMPVVLHTKLKTSSGVAAVKPGNIHGDVLVWFDSIILLVFMVLWVGDFWSFSLMIFDESRLV